MRVLILGAAGFLGSALWRVAEQSGHECFGADIRPSAFAPRDNWYRTDASLQRFDEVIRRCMPDALFLAAGSASVPDSYRDPLVDFHNNVATTELALDAVRVANPRCRVVLLSSAAVYGNPVALPIAEECAVSPVSPYGFHKRQAELACEMATRCFGASTAIVRIFSAYGAGLRRQVIFDLCEKTRVDDPITVQGTGDETRDFINAQDVARALCTVMEKGAFEADVYNVASGVETPVRSIVQLVLAATSRRNEVVFSGALPPGTPIKWRANINRVSRLGFQPQVDLREGIADYVAWWRTHCR